MGEGGRGKGEGGRRKEEGGRRKKEYSQNSTCHISHLALLK
jgi:hypothetical protein